MKVSYLGMGAMGSNMAMNILKQGFNLTVWNRQDSNWPEAERLGKEGARVCKKIEDAVVDADFVFLSLTNDDAVRTVVNDIIENLNAGVIAVDNSTTSPDLSENMNKLLKERDCFFIDAPVSGGIEGAREGTLSVMAGGDYGAFRKSKEIISSYSSNIVYMGESGNGQRTKLINQLLTGVNQAIVCEAMLMAKTAGIDMHKLFSVLINSWGNSKMLERSVENFIIPDKYESVARIELMLKDLRLVEKMSEEIGLRLSLLQISLHFYEKAVKNGLGKLDHAAIIKIMEQENCKILMGHKIEK